MDSVVNSGVPIALFSGTKDTGSNPTDVAWLTEQIQKAVVYTNDTYPLEHFEFMYGEDMSYMFDLVKVLD